MQNNTSYIPVSHEKQPKYNPMTYGLYSEPNNGNNNTKDSSSKFMTSGLQNLLITREFPLNKPKKNFSITDLSPRQMVDAYNGKEDWGISGYEYHPATTRSRKPVISKNKAPNMIEMI